MRNHEFDTEIIIKTLEIEKSKNQEKQPKTSGLIDFSTSNIQISHADACVRRRVGTPTRTR